MKRFLLVLAPVLLVSTLSANEVKLDNVTNELKIGPLAQSKRFVQAHGSFIRNLNIINNQKSNLSAQIFSATSKANVLRQVLREAPQYIQSKISSVNSKESNEESLRQSAREKNQAYDNWVSQERAILNRKYDRVNELYRQADRHYSAHESHARSANSNQITANSYMTQYNNCVRAWNNGTGYVSNCSGLYYQPALQAQSRSDDYDRRARNEFNQYKRVFNQAKSAERTAENMKNEYNRENQQRHRTLQGEIASLNARLSVVQHQISRINAEINQYANPIVTSRLNQEYNQKSQQLNIQYQSNFDTMIANYGDRSAYNAQVNFINSVERDHLNNKEVGSDSYRALRDNLCRIAEDQSGQYLGHICDLAKQVSELVSTRKEILAERLQSNFFKACWVNDANNNDSVAANQVKDGTCEETLLDLQDAEEITQFSGLGLSNLNIVKEFTQVKKLDLSENNLTAIYDIMDMKNIEVLNLENNEIKDFAPLHLLRDLKKLTFHDNDISIRKSRKLCRSLNLSGECIYRD